MDDEELVGLARQQQILPPVESYELTPIETALEEDQLNLQAIRRQKVRELRNMGYTPTEIYKVISKGLVINNKTFFVETTPGTIKNDLSYLMQEDLASDVTFPEKKAAIKSKYEFLYRQAMLDYASTKGQAKVSFLNAAKAVLDKLTELEGVAAPKLSFEKKVIEHTKTSILADELKEGISKDERNALVTSIDKVLAGRKRGRVGGVTVAPKASRVRAHASEDGDVPN